MTITAEDEGAAYAGSPGVSVFSAGSSRWELVDADFNLICGLTFDGPQSGIGILARNGSTNNDFFKNRFHTPATAIRIDGGADDVLRENLVRSQGVSGFVVNGGSTTLIVDNDIQGPSTGISSSSSGGDIHNNTVIAKSTGISISSAGGPTTISGNRVSGTSNAALSLSGTGLEIFDNEIFGSQIGVDSFVSDAHIFGNDIHDNLTGLRGRGLFGGEDWSDGQVNDIHNNATGISATGSSEVRFNRIHHNQVGLEASNSADVHHNVVFRNTATAVEIERGAGVSLINNTVYADAGDAVVVQARSRDTILRNNILWTDSGFALRVATDSQVGFDSDYNNLYATGTGQPVFWQKPFADLFDWQVEADFDRHSIGFTLLNPRLDDPQFADLANDDYHLSPGGSTSIDAADPASGSGLEPAPHGGLRNLGAYGGTSEAALSRSAFVEIDSPNFYVDVESGIGNTIHWHTFDDAQADMLLAGSVDIDLIEEGVGKVADIAVVPARNGTIGWTPASLGIASDPTKRYRIRITSFDTPSITDESRETFSITSVTNQYFVDDGWDDNDQYTPAASGNNRNTGKTAGDPKRNLLALLRAYDLGPGDTILMDTGDYLHVRNVLLNGAIGVNDDEGFTLSGPTDPTKVARIDRANQNSGTANIELDDADFVTIRHLTLVGADRGLWVHSNSTNFTGEHLVLSDNVGDGLRIESDAESTTLDSLSAFDNGGTGISVATPISRLNNSRAFRNVSTGIALSGQIDVVMQGNEVFDNRVGISISSNLGASHSLLGVTDLSLNENPAPDAPQGNKVYDNVTTGISASGNVLVAGNHVFGHSGTGSVGISLSGGAEARHNLVHDNYNGLTMPSVSGVATARGNRVYDNSNMGISASFSSQVLENIVYSNSIGLSGTGFRGTMANNLVYANTNQGIQLLSASSGIQVLNNTVYQEVGNAIRLGSNSSDVVLRNNILWVEAGFAISVADNSQQGFDSDYNLFRIGDDMNARVGLWGSAVQDSLADWQLASSQDANSISGDPLFVDIDGADNQLG